MLKASDLRTGNLLEYYISADNFDWEIFTIDWQDIRECEEHNESFNSTHRGVNITANLLLNLGFIKKNNTPSIELYIKEDFIVRFDPQDKFQFYINGKCINIDYVHQLQNLYFALTKNELTL